MHQIREVAAKNKVCLSYEMVLTRLFKAAKIFLKNEGFKKQSHFDIYDAQPLSQMQYHMEDERWVKNVCGQERKELRRCIRNMSRESLANHTTQYWESSSG